MRLLLLLFDDVPNIADGVMERAATAIIEKIQFDT
jgi:hypothetical protein